MWYSSYRIHSKPAAGCFACKRIALGRRFSRACVVVHLHGKVYVISAEYIHDEQAYEQSTNTLCARTVRT